MLILGISVYYHDSAACIIKDDQVIVAIEEERFSRIKHDNNFPYKAIEFCLKSQKIKVEEIDCVAYYEKPLLKFERILETFLDSWPFSFVPFLKGIPEWLGYKIKIEATIKKLGFKNQIFFIPHHYSHAAVTFYPSPFKEAAILTVDGVGEYQTTGLWRGKGKSITQLKSINFPHSLGLLYSTFTAHLGFKVNEDEYKVMGLAANGKIYEKTPFKKVYIFGASGDSGAAVGAGLFVHNHVIQNESGPGLKKYPINNLCFGSEYNNDQIELNLKKYNLKYKKFVDEEKLINKTAKLLSQGKIIGWFQGKMEFGPRALGNRSILAKPNPRSMKDRVNEIKLREQFRPFAGSILQDKVHEYFDVPEKNLWSPFMTFCFQVKKEKQNMLSAIVHKDGTCRIQTVDKTNGRYSNLIRRFYHLTGIPCILNTSFNLKGESIVETPQQAIEDFLKTKMDYLVIGDFLVFKTHL